MENFGIRGFFLFLLATGIYQFQPCTSGWKGTTAFMDGRFNSNFHLYKPMWTVKKKTWLNWYTPKVINPVSGKMFSFPACFWTVEIGFQLFIREQQRRIYQMLGLVCFFTLGNISCCLEAPNHCCADLCVKKVVVSFFFSLMVTEIAICGFTAVCCG